MNKEKEVKAYLAGELQPEDRMKYEIAEEMGLIDRVLSDGWKSLSAKETGRIGGLMTKRKREKQESIKKVDDICKSCNMKSSGFNSNKNGNIP